MNIRIHIIQVGISDHLMWPILIFNIQFFTARYSFYERSACTLTKKSWSFVTILLWLCSIDFSMNVSWKDLCAPFSLPLFLDAYLTRVLTKRKVQILINAEIIYLRANLVWSPFCCHSWSHALSSGDRLFLSNFFPCERWGKDDFFFPFWAYRTCVPCVTVVSRLCKLRT